MFLIYPLPDSSNREDVDKHPEFYDLGCHDLYTYSSDHDVDPIVVNLSKTLVYHDLSVNKVKTPQTVKSLQPKMMVMLGHRCPKVDFTSGQEIVETLKAPHHSLLCIEYQPNTQILVRPLERHDPISLTLEESYTASIHAQHKWSTLLTFACMSQSRECIHSTSTRSVAQRHGKSTECISCTFMHLCSVVACTLRVCPPSSLYLSCLMVCATAMFTNHAFTNMGQPMCRWLHWKYHFT